MNLSSKQDVRLSKKYHNRKLQINPRHSEEDTLNRNSHMIARNN